MASRNVRDVSDMLWPAVAETLASLELDPEYSGAKKLAQRYAQVIDQHDDQAWAVRWIGPELLKALDALGATPDAKARIHAITKGGGDSAGNAAPTRLDQLRQSRASRRT